jgi:hypothetical protein
VDTSQAFRTVTSCWTKTTPSQIFDTALDDTFQFFTKLRVSLTAITHSPRPTHAFNLHVHTWYTTWGRLTTKPVQLSLTVPSLSLPSSLTQRRTVALFALWYNYYICYLARCSVSFLQRDTFPRPQPGPPLAHWPFGFTFKYSAILSSPILKQSIISYALI